MTSEIIEYIRAALIIIPISILGVFIQSWGSGVLNTLKEIKDLLEEKKQKP